jgi:hypothetical protein
MYPDETRDSTCMYVRLVDGGMPYEEEDTCMYVRLLCASHTLTGAGGAGAGAGARPPPPPAPVCMGARNDSSKALSSSSSCAIGQPQLVDMPARTSKIQCSRSPARASFHTHSSSQCVSVSEVGVWVGGGVGGGVRERERE